MEGLNFSRKSHYEAEEDETVAVIGEVPIDSNARLRVSIKRYKGGQLKVDLIKVGQRRGNPADEWYSPKIGRLTVDVAVGVSALIADAAATIEDMTGKQNRRISIIRRQVLRSGHTRAA